MNIGIFGLWGMNTPEVSFGGFETGFSEVAWRLAEQGHRVTIYCRRERYPHDARPDYYRGVRLIYVPSVDNKNLSFLSALTNSLVYASMKEKHDIYLFANVGSGMHCLIFRLLGKKVVLNVDGLDWVRAKWGVLARTYFRLSARAALFSCDALITDADAMVDFYMQHFRRRLAMIAYGAYIEHSEDASLISQFGVQSGQYYLVASRLIPENNADVIIEAFKRCRTNKILLIVGDANYDSPFHYKIRNSGDPRVQFTGWINNQKVIKELHCNCYAYIHGHSVGGTNPALLKALGFSNLVLALNTSFNAEVLKNGEYGLLWERDPEDLRDKLQMVEEDSVLVRGFRSKATERIRERYTWELITSQYEALLTRVHRGESETSRRMRKVRMGLAAGLLALGIIAIRP